MIEQLLRQERQSPHVPIYPAVVLISITIILYLWQQRFWTGWVLIPGMLSIAATNIYTMARTQRKKIDKINATRFNPIFWQRFEQLYPNVSIRERRLIEQGFKDYLALHALHRYAYAMPSHAVDALWHVMLEFPVEYQQLCQHTIGRPLTHEPYTNSDVPEENALNMQRQRRQLFNTWHIGCTLERLNPRNSQKLPRLFAIDQALGWSNAQVFSLAALYLLYDQFKSGSGSSGDSGSDSDSSSDGCSSCSSCGSCGGGGGD